MYADDEACKRAGTMYIVWTRNMKQCSTERLAAKLAATHRQSIPIQTVLHKDGAYNRCYKITFKQGPEAIVRLPMLGRVALRREKTDNEISVMEYITKHTSIPTPKIIGSGACAVGPYVVMEFIDGTLLSDHLHAPMNDLTKAAVLNADISEYKLIHAYR